jgi:hypothetical protein
LADFPLLVNLLLMLGLLQAELLPRLQLRDFF